MALRFFAGGCPYNIMQVHSVSLQSVYDSVWGVVNAINACGHFDYTFPSHEQQRKIASGFLAQSGAGFDNVVGVIDGLVMCMHMPNLSESIDMNCGQANFRFHQKDKYGLNLQAICDHCALLCVSACSSCLSYCKGSATSRVIDLSSQFLY